MTTKTEHPWRFGANFIPSNAINQLEMWQQDTFAPDVIDRELGFAEGIGMNLVRVYLHDLLWEHDADGFASRIDQFLDIAAKHGIDAMFVLFDDCWHSSFQLGPQPQPKPFTHNSGWLQSPGTAAVDDPAQRPRLERYIKGVLSRFGDDPRVALWDLYNEPGASAIGKTTGVNDLRLNASLALLQDVFRWAREVAPSQPLTAAPWRFDPVFDQLNRLELEQSGVVSFHCYANHALTLERAQLMRLLAKGRPVLCSEYMARTLGSTFQDIGPLLKSLGIGAVNWGLVAGKTQTIYPWGWNASRGNPPLPFHDIFRPDGSFLIPEEEPILRQLGQR